MCQISNDENKFENISASWEDFKVSSWLHKAMIDWVWWVIYESNAHQPNFFFYYYSYYSKTQGFNPMFYLQLKNVI